MITVTPPLQLEMLPTDAASERRISGETLNAHPIERPGEVLEGAPGLIVTQHSGEGKAKQLRPARRGMARLCVESCVDTEQTNRLAVELDRVAVDNNLTGGGIRRHPQDQ